MKNQKGIMPNCNRKLKTCSVPMIMRGPLAWDPETVCQGIADSLQHSSPREYSASAAKTNYITHP